MDFISKYFVQYQDAFASRLENAGFLRDERNDFLREVSSAILLTIRKMNLEAVIKILLSDNPSRLLDNVDHISMATKLGLDVTKITTGLEVIAPVIKQVFIHNNKEIVTATASLAWETTDESLVSVNGHSA